MHIEKLMGRIVGGFAAFAGIIFFAVAVLGGEEYWRLGWIDAVSGWFLTASGIMSIGDLRAEAEMERERCAKVAENMGRSNGRVRKPYKLVADQIRLGKDRIAVDANG